MIITGISHVGTQPTVQWKSQQVPIPMFGISSQATNSTFWKDTNGATEGVIYQAVSGPGVAVTPKTLPFVAAFKKRFGNIPSYCGYTAYDEVYYIADAIKRAGSHRQRQARRRHGEDRLRRHDRPRSVPPERRPACAWAEDRQGLHHGPDAAMAGRQAGQYVASDLANGKLKFPSFIKFASGQ